MGEEQRILIDRYQRVHNYLRISLTDNCNLRCFYCMPDEHYQFTPPAQLMQPDEIEAIARVFVAHGVNKIRLTGGEPLVRKDAADIIERLGHLPAKLTMTTNGTRLHEFAEVISAAGITSLNISLDTLQPDKFLLLTRRNQWQQVRSNIDLMLAKGMHVKVNVVVTRGVNDEEILDFIRWTKAAPVHIRFIEFMPFTGNHWSSNKVYTWQEILDTVSSRYRLEPLQREKHDTAKAYRIPGHAGTFAVISTMSAPFCGDCNRMRLTADGKMKNCLFSQSETDLLGALRRGEDLGPLLQANIADKHAAQGGQLHPVFQQIDAAHIDNRSMIAIGG